MPKEFIDIFVELADEADKTDARRVARALNRNGVDSLAHLVNMADDHIAALPGIGPRAMHIIGMIKTRERFKAEKKISEYKKMKGKEEPKTFKYYLQKAGCTYLEACNIEHIVKKNGCRTIDEFMLVGENCYSGWKGIGPARNEKLIATHAIIAKDLKVRTTKRAKTA